MSVNPGTKILKLNKNSSAAESMTCGVLQSQKNRDKSLQQWRSTTDRFLFLYHY